MLEYLYETIFLQEVEASGQVWVAKGGNDNIYALQLDEMGFSLPIWSGRERVIDFLRNQSLIGQEYEPHPVPLDIFTERWLSDNIAALLINIDGIATRVLVLSVEQFRLTQIFKLAG